MCTGGSVSAPTTRSGVGWLRHRSCGKAAGSNSCGRSGERRPRAAKERRHTHSVDCAWGHRNSGSICLSGQRGPAATLLSPPRRKGRLAGANTAARRAFDSEHPLSAIIRLEVKGNPFVDWNFPANYRPGGGYTTSALNCARGPLGQWFLLPAPSTCPRASQPLSSRAFIPKSILSLVILTELTGSANRERRCTR